eukprot:GHVN01039884.1.p1 GENE.GHVN01039884.1~~GHVN01039884.1.p1  ORF type:complete len:510 (-),score=163.23 GHVN01039884.1:91-1620(-)
MERGGGEVGARYATWQTPASLGSQATTPRALYGHRSPLKVIKSSPGFPPTRGSPVRSAASLPTGTNEMGALGPSHASSGPREGCGLGESDEDSDDEERGARMEMFFKSRSKEVNEELEAHQKLPESVRRLERSLAFWNSGGLAGCIKKAVDARERARKANRQKEEKELHFQRRANAPFPLFRQASVGWSLGGDAVSQLGWQDAQDANEVRRRGKSTAGGLEMWSDYFATVSIGEVDKSSDKVKEGDKFQELPFHRRSRSQSDSQSTGTVADRSLSRYDTHTLTLRLDAQGQAVVEPERDGMSEYLKRSSHEERWKSSAAPSERGNLTSDYRSEGGESSGTRKEASWSKKKSEVRWMMEEETKGEPEGEVGVTEEDPVSVSEVDWGGQGVHEGEGEAYEYEAYEYGGVNEGGESGGGDEEAEGGEGGEEVFGAEEVSIDGGVELDEQCDASEVIDVGEAVHVSEVVDDAKMGENGETHPSHQLYLSGGDTGDGDHEVERGEGGEESESSK